MKKLLSRKEALGMIDAIFTSFHFGLMSITDSGIDNSWERDYFWEEANKVDQGRLKKDYEQTVNSLDAIGFKEYYKLIGKFATKYKIGSWKEYNEYEPILIEELNEELRKYDKTEDKLELINSFTVDELQSESFIFDSKVQVLYDILDDFNVGNNKEEGINTVLESFNSSDKASFITKLQTDKNLLNALIDKVNGTQKDEMLALMGEMFISSGFITSQKQTLLGNEVNDTISASFNRGNINIKILGSLPGMRRDDYKGIKKNITVSPFEIIGMNYDGREIQVPAFLLLNSWSNSLAEPEGIFFNYKHEDIDWNSLDEKQKDEYFYEFVTHYLPSGFIKALGSPIQLVITGLITVGLAITTGGASTVAQLELALVAAGIALTGMSVYGSIRRVMAANEMKEAASTMHEAKKAAKAMAESIAKLTLDVINVICTVAGYFKGKKRLQRKDDIDRFHLLSNENKESLFESLSSNELYDMIQKNPRYEWITKNYDLITKDNIKDIVILRKDGYKRQSLIDQNAATIEKLQLDLPDDELIKILSKMKNKRLEKSIEHINNVIDVIDNIHVTKRSLVINNADTINELKKYYTSQEITDILNNVSTENFETTIKKMTNIQKELLSKNISSGETNKFARELLMELELKHGITEERLNVLRNLNYNKMTQSEYEKIKPEIDAIIMLTRSYDLNKVKPGMMRKYISIDTMNKYLSNGEKSKTISGFIARQEDVLQLKTFDDIFYTMRLDYEGNTFVYNREIAYIDFTANSYEDTFVPIGELYGGTENWPSPFGGMGLLKTENNQIIREYKTKDNSLDIIEAVMYKIDKDGNTVKIAEYDNDLKLWIKE